jgi:hypothetical protein
VKKKGYDPKPPSNHERWNQFVSQSKAYGTDLRKRLEEYQTHGPSEEATGLFDAATRMYQCVNLGFQRAGGIIDYLKRHEYTRSNGTPEHMNGSAAFGEEQTEGKAAGDSDGKPEIQSQLDMLWDWIQNARDVGMPSHLSHLNGHPLPSSSENLSPLSDLSKEQQESFEILLRSAQIHGFMEDVQAGCEACFCTCVSHWNVALKKDDYMAGFSNETPERLHPSNAPTVFVLTGPSGGLPSDTGAQVGSGTLGDKM